MWDDFGLGEHARSLISFVTGETHLLRDGRVAMGGMDVTNCDWLFEPNATNKSDADNG